MRVQVKVKPWELGKASQRREEEKGGEGKGSKEWIKLLETKRRKTENKKEFEDWQREREHNMSNKRISQDTAMRKEVNDHPGYNYRTSCKEKVKEKTEKGGWSQKTLRISLWTLNSVL